MPTRAFTARFYEHWMRLPRNQREAFRRARTRLFAHLVETGFHPPFPDGLRVHRLQGTDVWSLSFADATGRCSASARRSCAPGHIHIVWEFIGTHSEYEREY